MVVSAVFGSPMLTCCLGIGISTLIGAYSSGGYVAAPLDSELLLSFLFMAISLLSSLIVIIVNGFKLPRWYAYVLLIIYATYMLFSILDVTGTFSVFSGSAPPSESEGACPKL